MHETVDTTTTSRRLSSELRRGVPQPLDLGVDRRVLLDEGVGLRDVRLGLVVVVVADEVLDRVVRHELAELVRELGRERLVVREHERRALHLLDEPGGRRRLAGSGRAQQHDVGLARVDAGRELFDGRAAGRRSGEYSLMTSGPTTWLLARRGTARCSESTPTSSVPMLQLLQYIEFRVGPTEHEFGIVDRRFGPPASDSPSGALLYWHVDDAAATLDRLVALERACSSPSRIAKTDS